MSPDDRIKFTIGDLVVRNAILHAENERLRDAMSKDHPEEGEPLAADDLHP